MNFFLKFHGVTLSLIINRLHKTTQIFHTSGILSHHPNVFLVEVSVVQHETKNSMQILFYMAGILGIKGHLKC